MHDFDNILKYYIEYESHNRLNGLSIRKNAKTVKESYISNMSLLENYILNRKREGIYSKIKFLVQNDQKCINIVDEIISKFTKDINILKSNITEVFKNNGLKVNDNNLGIIQIIANLLVDQSIMILYPTYQIGRKTHYLNCFKCQILGQQLMVDAFRVNQSFIDKLYLTKKGYGLDEYFGGEQNRSGYFEGLQKIELTTFAESKDIITSKLMSEFKEIAESLQTDSTEKALATFDEFEDVYFPPFKSDMQMIMKDSRRTNIPLLNKYIMQNNESKSIDKIKLGTHLGSYTNKYPVNEKQWMVMNALNSSELLAVSGPPGTGKTTLLKEIIANTHISKTKRLIQYWDEEWQQEYYGQVALFDAHILKDNLDSIVVTSTNNEAVNNIGLEASQEIEVLKKKLGLTIMTDFSAQLGKKDNRLAFKQKNLMRLVESLSQNHGEITADDEIHCFKEMEVAINKLTDRIKSYLEDIDYFKNKNKLIMENDFGYFKYNETFANRDTYRKEIQDLSNKIEHLSQEKKNKSDELEIEQKQRVGLSDDIFFINKQIRDKREKIASIQEKKDSFVGKILMNFSFGHKLILHLWGDEARHNDELINLRSELREFKGDKDLVEEKITRINSELEILNRFISAYRTDFAVLNDEKNRFEDFVNRFNELSKIIKPEILVELDNHYELFNCPIMLSYRYKMFELSLVIQEKYLLKHSKAICNNIQHFMSDEGNVIPRFYRSGFRYTQSDILGIKKIWSTFCLCFPVITSTLHSFGRENMHMIQQLFDLILVDEAGQILPYYLVGPLYRARRAVIVGDKKQLEPIRDSGNRVFSKYESLLACEYDVNESTAQSIASMATDYYEEDKSNSMITKQGILLEEHRRCQSSIVQFSNEYVYDNKMIIVNKDESTEYLGDNFSFIDIRGIKRHNSNVSEAKAIKVVVAELLKSFEAKDIAIITPYSNQVNLLKKIINNEAVGIGTVHSFQGKDKEAVVFSMVVDSIKDYKAMQFIGAKPNMLNVAFTRAKKQLIIIGNYSVAEDAEKDNFLSKVHHSIQKYGKVLTAYNDEYLKKMLPKEREAYFNIIHSMSGENIGQEYIFKAFTNSVGLIEDKHHYTFLLSLFKSAKKSVEVISPWITQWVVDNEFLGSLKNYKTDDKVYRIVFGSKRTSYNLDSIENIEKIVDADSSYKSNNSYIVKSIVELKNILGEDLIYRPPLHTKALLIDRQYLCIGSHNWLSKKGQKDGNKEELTVVINDQGMVDYICDKYNL